MWFHYPKAYPKSINTKASQIVYITIPFTHLQRIMRWKFNSISYFRRGEAFRRHIQSIICLCISEQYGSSYFGHLLEMCRALLWLCNVELCTFSLSFHLLFSSLFNALTCSICVGNQLLLPRSLSLCVCTRQSRYCIRIEYYFQKLPILSNKKVTMWHILLREFGWIGTCKSPEMQALKR